MVESDWLIRLSNSKKNGTAFRLKFQADKISRNEKIIRL